MCNPAATLGMQAIGGAQSALGAYGQAASQKSSLQFDARVADLNASIAERQAQVALEQGQYQVNQLRRQTAGLKGEQRATMAAGNLDLTYGTPAQVLTSTDVMGEQDVQQAEINAVREAWGYRTQATNSRNEGALGRARAKAIKPAMAASTSLLGSATSVAQSFYGFKKAGAFG